MSPNFGQDMTRTLRYSLGSNRHHLSLSSLLGDILDKSARVESTGSSGHGGGQSHSEEGSLKDGHGRYRSQCEKERRKRKDRAADFENQVGALDAALLGWVRNGLY